MTHPSQIDVDSIFHAALLAKLSDAQQQQLKCFIEELCELAVNRYRKLKRLEKQKKTWKLHSVHCGRFSRDIGFRRGLERIEEVVRQINNVTNNDTDIRDLYVLKLIKNNETCLNIAYNYLLTNYEKSRIERTREIDNDTNRLINFVINGTDICWSRPQIQAFKNLVCFIICHVLVCVCVCVCVLQWVYVCVYAIDVQ